MKKTLGVRDIQAELEKDKNANWSYEGSLALAEYLDELDNDNGEETELDIVAIRCEYSEYSTAKEAASNYSWDHGLDRSNYESDEEFDQEVEDDALDYLKEQTTVIEFSDGLIIRDF